MMLYIITICHLERPYWAKDLCFVFVDGVEGMSAWLQSYHGIKSQGNLNNDQVFIIVIIMSGWEFDNLEFHAGSIQAALALDFGNHSDYNLIGTLLG